MKRHLLALLTLSLTLTVLSLPTFSQVVSGTGPSTITTRGTSRRGEVTYVASSGAKPTCNASSVNTVITKGYDNRSNETCKLVSGGTYAWVDDEAGVYRPERFGGIADNSTDNTTAVQAALTALGNNSGTVIIPNGMKFSLTGLTYGKQVVIHYRADDDLDNADYYTGQNSGERIIFSANASTGGGGGIVNEQEFSSTFNPGIILNVYKKNGGHDAFLGVGQDRANPARVSFLMRNERNNMFGIQHIQYPSYSSFSGNYVTGYRKTITITGITTASFGSVPATYEKITGSTSGATGYILSTSGSNIVVLWISGKFVVGETVADSNETTSHTIATSTFLETGFPTLTQSERTGHWAIGQPPDAPTHLFSVGGDIGITKTRTASQYVETTIAHPALHFLDGYEEASPSGFSLRYDTTSAAGSRTIGLRTYGGSYELWRLSQPGIMSMHHSNGNSIFDVRNNGSGEGLIGVNSGGNRVIQIYAGGNNYFNHAASTGFGFATAPDAKVEIRATTEQFRLCYSAGNCVPFTVSSSGDMTLAPTGGDLAVTGNLAANSGDVQVGTAGKTLQIKTGSNACSGSATLSSGTATVSTTCTGTTWGTNFIVILTPYGSSTGALRVSSFTGSTSFVITSTDGASSDPVGWVIIKQN